jgi:ATP-dependent helicase/nuclease subunit A
VKGTGGLRPIADVKETIKAGDMREQGRLLYVAMTRARDRLYIAGFHNGALSSSSWYATIQNALAPVLQEAQDFAGRTVWRTGPWQGFSAPAANAAKADGDELPLWLAVRAAKERQQPVLSPSRIMELAGVSLAALAQQTGADRETAQARGTLIHRLLEVLPGLPAQYRTKAAGLIAATFSGELSTQHREDAARHVLALLGKGALAQGSGERLSETGLAVTVYGAEGKAIAAILGQADRIELGDAGPAVLDYKSGSLPKDGTAKPSHLAQLACYKLALERLYPDTDIRAAIFDTGTGNATEAAGEDVDAVLQRVLAAL